MDVVVCGFISLVFVILCALVFIDCLEKVEKRYFTWKKALLVVGALTIIFLGWTIVAFMVTGSTLLIWIFSLPFLLIFGIFLYGLVVFSLKYLYEKIIEYVSKLNI